MFFLSYWHLTLLFLLLALLSLVLFSRLLGLRLLLVCRGLNLFHHSLYTSTTNIDLLQVDVGGVFKRVQFAHGSLDLVSELMGTHALENSIVLVGEDDVALGIKLKNEMIAELLLSEGQYNHSLHADLPNGLQPLGAQEFPKLTRSLDYLHGEAGRHLVLFCLGFGSMKPHSIFAEQVVLVISTRHLKKVGGWTQIVDVGESAAK